MNSFWDSIINNLYNSPFLGRIFHTLNYCLQKELEDCESVLDIGCGPSSPLQYCKNIKYSVGVEPFKPYLEESKKRKIHTKYINKKIEEIDFPEKSFDAVIMIEVLEHLPKKMGYEILKKAEKWAKEKIIISTPNGFLPQNKLDQNPWQQHLSAWSIADFYRLKYTIFGLAGLKFLREPNKDETMSAGLLSPIKYKPQFFWFLIITLSQLFVYFLPNLAFELFCVKKK